MTQRDHQFNKDVIISEEGKQFINSCLKKNMEDRPTTAELLNHEWFYGFTLDLNQVSQLRVKAIQGSLKESEEVIEREAIRLCEIMIFGVFEEHLKKVGKIMCFNTDIIRKNKEIHENYYRDSTSLLYYFMIIAKKLRNL